MQVFKNQEYVFVNDNNGRMVLDIKNKSNPKFLKYYPSEKFILAFYLIKNDQNLLVLHGDSIVIYSIKNPEDELIENSVYEF